MAVKRLIKCPTCIGIGYCSEADICATCEGTGEVPRDEVILEDPCQPTAGDSGPGHLSSKPD
jgi:hypothetical protein